MPAYALTPIHAHLHASGFCTHGESEIEVPVGHTALMVAESLFGGALDAIQTKQ